MSKTDFSTALTEAELDRLATFLAQFPGAMNLERMDGFFSALICAPQTAPMGEAMSRVWGDEADFASEAEVQEIASLLMRHWNTISRGLAGNDLYWPILLEDEAGQVRANEWAHSFCLGMKLSGGWSPLFDDEEQGGWIVPILALAHEHDPDPTMRPGVIDQERREQMIAGIVAGLKKIHGYFAPRRRTGVPEAATPHRHRAPRSAATIPVLAAAAANSSAVAALNLRPCTELRGAQCAESAKSSRLRARPHLCAFRGRQTLCISRPYRIFGT